MTALSVVQRASSRISIARPDQLFGGSASPTVLQLQDTLNEVAAMIAFDSGRDWTALKTLGTLVGDGSALGFDFPTDYKRMLKKGRLWSTASPNSPFTHYPDSDAWLGTQVQSFQAMVGGWTILGDQIHVRNGGNNSAIAVGQNLQFYYLTKNVWKDKNGVPKPECTADDDVFRLDERLLRLALIYRWKQDKQQDYAEAMTDYEEALASTGGADKGSNILVVGSQRLPAGVEYAWPGVIVP